MGSVGRLVVAGHAPRATIEMRGVGCGARGTLGRLTRGGSRQQRFLEGQRGGGGARRTR
jgi:hypothetical protein